MRKNVYILTKDGNEITESGREIIRNAVTQNTNVCAVDIHGGAMYNDAQLLSNILTEEDVVGVSIPEHSKCYFISGPENISSLKKALLNTSAQTSWEIAKEYIS